MFADWWARRGWIVCVGVWVFGIVELVVCGGVVVSLVSGFSGVADCYGFELLTGRVSAVG